MGAPIVDLQPVFDRHGHEATAQWLSEHVQAVALMVATGAVAVDDSRHDTLLLERLVLHLVAETLAAPIMHHRWQTTGHELALEGYGATQGAITVAGSILDEFAAPPVLAHVQRELQALADTLAAAAQLPDTPPEL